MVKPSLRAVIDGYRIEKIHPIGKDIVSDQSEKGWSNNRYIVGGKLCWLITFNSAT
jgi:hypothetical protein